ncbi:hypothetical protein FOA24_29630 [Bacillus thuringiensis]
MATPFTRLRKENSFREFVKIEVFNYILSSTGIHVHFLLSIATIEGKGINLTHTKLEALHT